MIKQDGHIHTPFCPHGSSDPLKAYIEEAINQGFGSITFTEHAPLPEGFNDPVPQKDSAMPLSQMELYLKQVSEAKQEYKQQIEIKVGLEVDYINGFEQDITSFLDTYGPQIDDSILSVHFLPANGDFLCMDYDDSTFGELISIYGTIENVYEAYYKQVYSSIITPLGRYKPTRIGHIALVKKYVERFPYIMSERIRNLLLLCLDEISASGMELDFNTSGLRKKLAKTIYLEEWMIEAALQKKIPLIFGSDAHQASDIGYSYHRFSESVIG
ncbi:histidinol-phosphatase HisJ [Bacillus gobiensis]|uniref:histidinol-phosphatase HisJ n=1 Tax=Bacillus gobiensis TaxID=1441095 RepID=UPI003D1A76CB